jgi:hypothetical protein
VELVDPVPGRKLRGRRVGAARAALESFSPPADRNRSQASNPARSCARNPVWPAFGQRMRCFEEWTCQQ